MFRHAALLVVVTAALALSGGTARADQAAERPAGRAPSEVTVTRPKGFSWPDALLGAGAACGVITVVAAATALAGRRRPPKRRSP